MDQQEVILITGAASGIGLYLAEKLFKQRYRLALGDIASEKLEQLAEKQQWDKTKVLTLPLDVSMAESWKRALENTVTHFGKLDVLMNVAGVIRPGYIHEQDLKDVDYHIDINLKGTIYGTKLASELMVAQQSGQIINVASLAGITPVPGLNLYCASKFGMRGFTLSIAEELRQHNIFVSLVCPDAVHTPMLTLQLDYPQAALTFSGNKVLTVEEIGEVILEKAFHRKKREVVYPANRGLTAKMVGFYPRLANLLLKKLQRKGLKKQDLMKRQGS